MENGKTPAPAEFKFLIRTCRECGFLFGVTPETQAWLCRKNLGLFTRCPECREKRRLAKQREGGGGGG